MVPRAVTAIRPLAVILAVALAGAIVACDKVPLTAPTESTINLFASGSTVPLNGSVELIATVTESAGTPVQNGTLVSFTTTLGRVEPADARTSAGRATARLVSDGRSGTARVVAYSGPAVSEALELTVGAAADGEPGVTRDADVGSAVAEAPCSWQQSSPTPMPTPWRACRSPSSPTPAS